MPTGASLTFNWLGASAVRAKVGAADVTASPTALPEEPISSCGVSE